MEGGRTRERAKEQGLGGQDVCAVTDGRKAEEMTARRRRRGEREEEKKKIGEMGGGYGCFFREFPERDSPRKSHEADRMSILLETSF